MPPDAIRRLNATLEGRYVIERELGAGGMATVYLAEDLRHDRKVAIKVLRPELAAVVGAERFLAEIRTTAQLQHPHILPLHDSGEAQGFLYYVMPYVEGESLRDRVDREKQLQVDAALDLVRKVGDALDYAHGKGVVHRDIKPANILLSERGEPLVADFGIALAVTQAGGGRITETGLSLGTPHYMSPEQATGDRDVDPRSDVYSLGCVLYELLAGDTPFAAKTAQAVLARILTETPRRVTEVRRTVPPHVESVIAKSLEKLPADRFASAREFLEALGREDFRYAADAETAAARSSGARPWRRERRVFLGVAAALTLALIAAVGGWLVGARDASLPVSPRAANIELPPGFEWEIRSVVRISPTGEHLAVYGGTEEGRGIWIRPTREPRDFELIPDTEEGQAFTFSPDGSRLAVTRPGVNAIVLMGLDGGSRIRLVGESARAMAWSDDGYIYYVRGPSSDVNTVVRRASVEGETDPVTVLAPAEFLSNHVTVTALPGGAGILVGRFSFGDAPPETWLVPTDSSGARRLLEDGVAAQYVETGHLAFIDRRGDLRVVAFDLGRLETVGPSVQVHRRISRTDRLMAAEDFTARFGVSDSGDLVFAEGPPIRSDPFRDSTALLEVTFAGDTTPLLTGAPMLSPAWSPDGRFVAYHQGWMATESQLQVHDVELRTQPRAVAPELSWSARPVWSPEGSRLLFWGGGSSGSAGILRVAPLTGGPGTAASEPVAAGADSTRWKVPLEWTESGVFWSGSDGVYFQKSLTEPPRLWLEAAVYDLEMSPDGELVVYSEVRDEGQVLVVRPFTDSGPGPELRVSEAGHFPKWSPDGSAVYFLDPSDDVVELRRARLSRDPALAVLDEETVLELPPGPTLTWDLHPDGDRIVWTKTLTGGEVAPDGAEGRPGVTPDRIWIVLDWSERVREAFAEERR